VVPLELPARLVENGTPALAFGVTRGFAERPLRCLSLGALHLSKRLRPCFDHLQAARFATLEAS
jgi:hypothetical protein